MTELAKIVAHYLERIVERSNLKGFDEIRAEVEAADEADAAVVRELETKVDRLERIVERLDEIITTPDWRERR